MEDPREAEAKDDSENDSVPRLNQMPARSRLYSRLSARDAAFLTDLEQASPVGALTLDTERERMKRVQDGAVPDPRVSCELFETLQCPIYILRPTDHDQPLPLTVYMHGGGWVLGELATHRRLVEQLATRTGSAVAFIEYPLAPEHPFPAALEACAGAVAELINAAELLRLDPERFAFAGDSSGANLAAALQMKLSKCALPQPAGIVLLYPALDASQSTESYEAYAENANLSRATMDWFWTQYIPSEPLRLDALASPLYAAPEALAQFPPTLCVTCEYDVLRDEGEEFAARLIGAGVDVTAVRWLGALHGFLANDVLAHSSSADECLNMVASFLRRIFEKTTSTKMLPGSG